MQVRILNEFKNLPCLIVIMEMDAEFIVHVPKAFYAAVFSGCYNPARFGKFRLASSYVFRIIEFVVASVFQGSVSVYP
jgi:hypothetical protein